MSYMEQFKTVMVGGFDKKDVMDGIAAIIKKYEDKLKEKDIQFDKIIKENENNKEKVKKMMVHLQQIKSELRNYEDNSQIIIKDKNENIDRKEKELNQLNNKIKELEKELERNNGSNELKKNIEIAQQIAKKKTNAIVDQAKKRIEQEYKNKIDNAVSDSEDMKRRARQEASRILQGASNRAKDILADVKQEAERVVVSAQSQAESIVENASITADSIIIGAAKKTIGYDDIEKETLKIDKESELETLKILQDEIDKEVALAIEHLNNAEETVKNATETIDNITNQDDKEEYRHKVYIKYTPKKEGFQ